MALPREKRNDALFPLFVFLFVYAAANRKSTIAMLRRTRMAAYGKASEDGA
jgi:hypothetical protein